MGIEIGVMQSEDMCMGIEIGIMQSEDMCMDINTMGRPPVDVPPRLAGKYVW